MNYFLICLFVVIPASCMLYFYSYNYEAVIMSSFLLMLGILLMYLNQNRHKPQYKELISMLF